jgi:transposase
MKNGEAYPIELRERVIESLETNAWTFEQAAKFFKVGVASVNRWCRLKRETGSLERRARGPGYPPKINETHRFLVAKIVDEKPDRTIKEIVIIFEQRSGVRISSSTMGRVLNTLGLTFKKKPSPRQRRIRIASKNGNKNICNSSKN